MEWLWGVGVGEWVVVEAGEAANCIVLCWNLFIFGVGVL